MVQRHGEMFKNSKIVDVILKLCWDLVHLKMASQSTLPGPSWILTRSCARSGSLLFSITLRPRDYTVCHILNPLLARDHQTGVCLSNNPQYFEFLKSCVRMDQPFSKSRVARRLKFPTVTFGLVSSSTASLHLFKLILLQQRRRPFLPQSTTHGAVWSLQVPTLHQLRIYLTATTLHPSVMTTRTTRTARTLPNIAILT